MENVLHCHYTSMVSNRKLSASHVHQNVINIWISMKFCWRLHKQKVEAEDQDVIQPNHPLETEKDVDRDRSGRETQQTQRKRVQLSRWSEERSWAGQVWGWWGNEEGVKGNRKEHCGREEEWG